MTNRNGTLSTNPDTITENITMTANANSRLDPTQAASAPANWSSQPHSLRPPTTTNTPTRKKVVSQSSVRNRLRTLSHRAIALNQKMQIPLNANVKTPANHLKSGSKTVAKDSPNT